MPGGIFRGRPGHQGGLLDDEPDYDPGPSGIIGPLTSRGARGAEDACGGRGNQAIVREMAVNLDTVKAVGHVLGKVGAANRTEAVRRRSGENAGEVTPWCPVPGRFHPQSPFW